MTEKNIFVYKLFLSLNILDFSLFFCRNCKPPLEKSHPMHTMDSPNGFVAIMSKTASPPQPEQFSRGSSIPKSDFLPFNLSVHGFSDYFVYIPNG